MMDPDIPCEWMPTRECIDREALARGNIALDHGDMDEARRIVKSGELTASERCVGVCTRYDRPVDAHG